MGKMQALVSRMAPTRLTSFAEKLKKIYGTDSVWDALRAGGVQALIDGNVADSVWLRTLPAAEFVAEDYLGNQYYEDKEEAARSYSPKRGRFVVYAAVVQPPSRLLPSVNRADPGSQIPTECLISKAEADFAWVQATMLIHAGLHFTTETPPVGPWRPVKPIYGLNKDPRLPVPDYHRKPKGWWSNPRKLYWKKFKPFIQTW